MEERILNTLHEVREVQKEMLTKQEELISFFKAEIEKANKIREEAILLQKQAVKRAKHISYFAFPLVCVCIFLLIYLISKYRIL